MNEWFVGHGLFWLLIFVIWLGLFIAFHGNKRREQS
jgi:hypothetical protein